MDKVVFNGVAKLVVEKSVDTSRQESLTAGSVYASDWIDVADYKKLEKIEGGLI